MPAYHRTGIHAEDFAGISSHYWMNLFKESPHQFEGFLQHAGILMGAKIGKDKLMRSMPLHQ